MLEDKIQSIAQAINRRRGSARYEDADDLSRLARAQLEQAEEAERLASFIRVKNG